MADTDADYRRGGGEETGENLGYGVWGVGYGVWVNELLLVDRVPVAVADADGGAPGDA